MIENRPGIYNAPSVYNQGGGDGTFKVEAGSIEQTLNFPPWLVPVEHIDLSDYAGTIFGIAGSWQLQLNNLDDLRCKFSYDPNKLLINGERLFVSGISLGEGGYNNTIDFNVNQSKQVTLYYGNVQCSVQNASFDPSSGMYVKYTGDLRRLYVVDGNGTSSTYNATSSYNTPKQGRWSLFGANQSPSYPFHGKIHYLAITNGDTIRSLFIPARAKNSANHQPYVVECVTGVVGINWSNNWSTSGIVFGHDIDLSDISSYFV